MTHSSPCQNIARQSARYNESGSWKLSRVTRTFLFARTFFFFVAFFFFLTTERVKPFDLTMTTTSSDGTGAAFAARFFAIARRFVAVSVLDGDFLGEAELRFFTTRPAALLAGACFFGETLRFFFSAVVFFFFFRFTFARNGSFAVSSSSSEEDPATAAAPSFFF